MMSEKTKSSTWKKSKIPRGKHHNKTATKTTVSVYLSKNLVEKAKKRNLNLSRVTEQSLSSILDYLETQNAQNNGISTHEVHPFSKMWTGLGKCPRLNPRVCIKTIKQI